MYVVPCVSWSGRVSGSRGARRHCCSRCTQRQPQPQPHCCSRAFEVETAPIVRACFVIRRDTAISTRPIPRSCPRCSGGREPRPLDAWTLARALAVSRAVWRVRDVKYSMYVVAERILWLETHDESAGRVYRRRGRVAVDRIGHLSSGTTPPHTNEMATQTPPHTQGFSMAPLVARAHDMT